MIQIFYIYNEHAIFILRLVVGIILLAHGLPKLKDRKTTASNFGNMGFKPGIFWGMLAGIVECVGGALLIAGFFTQLAALILAIEFIVILGWRLKTKQPLVGGYEIDLIMLAALLVLVASGSTYKSLDSFLGLLLW